MPDDDWVLAWTWGDGDFDLGMRACEGCECVAEKGAVQYAVSDARRKIKERRRTSCPSRNRPSRSSESRAFCIGE